MWRGRAGRAGRVLGSWLDEGCKENVNQTITLHAIDWDGREVISTEKKRKLRPPPLFWYKVFSACTRPHVVFPAAVFVHAAGKAFTRKHFCHLWVFYQMQSEFNTISERSSVQTTAAVLTFILTKALRTAHKYIHKMFTCSVISLLFCCFFHPCNKHIRINTEQLGSCSWWAAGLYCFLGFFLVSRPDRARNMKLTVKILNAQHLSVAV